MRRTTLVAALALAAALTAPATSLAGGFATVGLSSLPDGARPGEPWVVDLTVLQHGRTPLEGVNPAMIIEPAGGGTPTRFDAQPTGYPGVYRAEVVFPQAGGWSYAADDGFTAVHQLGTVTIVAASDTAPAAAATDRDMGLPGALGIAALAAVLAAFLAGPARRRFTSKPAGA
jgi:hypothetical protein